MPARNACSRAFFVLVCSVEALSGALSGWGDEMGAFVVVSHDRNFCRRIQFTHVATVRDGAFKLEQRDAKESDWVVEGPLAAVEAPREASASSRLDEEQSELEAKNRKKAYNAPKRIAKLEETIQMLEEKIAAIDEEMMSNGSDVGKLVDLTKEREKLQSQVAECLDEWEILESLLVK